MTDSYMRIRCCACYFDYYIYILNYRKNSRKYVNTLAGLWRLHDAHLTSDYYFISNRENVYHTCFDCFQNFLRISIFSRKSFVNNILNKNCVNKRILDIDCFKMFLQNTTSDNFDQSFPCLTGRSND